MLRLFVLHTFGLKLPDSRRYRLGGLFEVCAIRLRLFESLGNFNDLGADRRAFRIRVARLRHRRGDTFEQNFIVRADLNIDSGISTFSVDRSFCAPTGEDICIGELKTNSGVLGLDPIG